MNTKVPITVITGFLVRGWPALWLAERARVSAQHPWV